MNDEYSINETGDIKISDDVVASIAGLATAEIEGVTSIAGHITSEIVGRSGVKNLSKGIKLSIKDGVVTIDLYINIRYGYSIPKITAQIQERVKNAIESMTGLVTDSITIHIVDIEVK